MSWYESWFDADAYELVYDQRNLEDAERLADLIVEITGLEPGCTVLDVGTGRGRHARVLARRGIRVTGLDLSENALEAARARATAEGLKLGESVTFVQGDMRLPHLQERFDGVVNLFTSFGYFEDEADHERAVAAMHAALKPGGWLIQDFLNAPYVRASLVPQSEKAVGGARVLQERWVTDGATPRVEKRITLEPLADTPDGPEAPAAAPRFREGDARVFNESVRLLDRADFERMYAAVGLELQGVYGDFDGGPHTDASPRLILHARRPE